MVKAPKLAYLTAILCTSFLGGQIITNAQTSEVLREPSQRESRGPQVPSAKGRILLNIARAVIDVLCAEYGNCTANSNTPTETSPPNRGENGRSLTPNFAGPFGSSSTDKPRNFSFTTPPGWQSYEDISSVTVAPPSEYVDGDLTNGVILGMFDLNGTSFEMGAERYVRQLASNNKYLRRIGLPQSNIIDSVPCITNRLEGTSPKTHNVENVIVYTCRRNTLKLFYIVTVNSGPHASGFEEENSRIAQSINFRQ